MREDVDDVARSLVYHRKPVDLVLDQDTHCFKQTRQGKIESNGLINYRKASFRGTPLSIAD